jgi:transposase-like protein
MAPGLGLRDPVLRVPASRAAHGYTAKALERLHSQLRKMIKTRGHFPSDDAAAKLIWLAPRNITADSTGSPPAAWQGQKTEDESSNSQSSDRLTHRNPDTPVYPYVEPAFDLATHRLNT